MSDTLKAFWGSLAVDVANRRREIFAAAAALAEGSASDPTDPVEQALASALILRRHPDTTRDHLRDLLWQALLQLEAEDRVERQPPARLCSVWDYDHQLASLGEGAASADRDEEE